MSFVSARVRKPVNRYRLYSNLVCYSFLLPCLIYYVVFHYGPMYGTIIAFQEFNPFAGVLRD